MTPASRRERPAKPALTYEGIVTAAVAIMKAEGLEKLTMRRLATELDTGAASLYVYVRNTVELHAAVLDELLGEIPLDAAAGSWQDRVTAVLGAYTWLLFEHPALARSALVTRPLGPHSLALTDTVLGLLDEGGVARDRAAWGLDLLLQYATVQAAEHSTRARAFDADDQDDALEAALRSATPERYPHLAGRADELLSGPGEHRFVWGLHALLNGIASTPRP